MWNNYFGKLLNIHGANKFTDKNSYPLPQFKSQKPQFLSEVFTARKVFVLNL